MSCCKINNCFCLMLTLFRCPLITENKHLLCDPQLLSVTRNCQIYIMLLGTRKIGIYKLKDFMNCIKVKRNNLLNSIYSSVSPDFRFKENPTLISLLTRNCRVHCTSIKSLNQWSAKTNDVTVISLSSFILTVHWCGWSPGTFSSSHQQPGDFMFNCCQVLSHQRWQFMFNNWNKYTNSFFLFILP